MLPSELKPHLNTNSLPTQLPDSRIAAVDKETDRSKELRPCESFHDVLHAVNTDVEEPGRASYGSCRQCGERIESERLAEDPAAVLCLSCETAIEIDHTLRCC
jgi:RNA polymerase-binding transcription factor DksA